MSSCTSVGPVCKELTVLYSYKNELVAALAELSSTDIQCLSQDLSNFVVLNSGTSKIFGTLDYDNIKSSKIARYLIYHIFDGIEKNSAAFKKAMKVFSSQGGILRQLVLKINKSLSLQNSDQAVFVTKETLLDDNDVYIVVDILVKCSHKWDLLGIYLRLPKNVLEECKSSDNNTVRLYKVLSAWVTGRYTQAKEATLNNLKEALASAIVGEGRVALSLEEDYHKAKQPSINFETHILPDEIDSLFQIEFCSGDTKVADNKSTLLEVEVCPTKSVFYQWMKNGEPLSDNARFKGTQSSFLCIKKASQGTEGEYCCKITYKSEQLLSPVATVAVVYEKDKQHLLSLYSTLKEIPADSWPQIHCDKFIDVALIKTTKLQHRGSKFFTEKNVDKYLENKDNITYKDAFIEYEKGNLVLVEGRPGSGKTTLANKLAKDWAKGIVLKNANKVFLVSLRRIEARVQLFKNFFPVETEAKILLMEESGGEGVCFILDGYDEYRTEDENSIIQKLICQDFLPLSMIIVTSRPIKTTDLRPRATKRIEILGFTKNKFSDYVEHYPFNELVEDKNIVTIRSKAITYLERCSHVLGLCYLPVNASMICFLCSQQLDENIPKTETELYGNFVLAALLRELRRRKPTAQLKTLKDFEGENRNSLESLCTLAFNMTINNEQIVHNLPTQVNIIKDSFFVGLLCVDQITKMHNLEDVTCFLHLTLQEYLAAYHLSCLDDDEKMKMISLHSGKDHMLTTFKFYSGLVNFKNKMSQFEKVAESVGLECTYVCQCAYETQDNRVCSKVIEILQGQIRVDVGILAAADFTALAYVISKSSHPVISMNILPCQIYEGFSEEKFESVSVDSKRTLAQVFETNTTSVMKFLTKQMFNQRLTYTKSVQLQHILRDTDLDIDRNSNEGLLEYKNMLKLSSDIFSTASAEPLVSALTGCKTIHNLSLLGNCSSTKAANAIADIMRNSASLEILTINGIIGSSGAAIISEGLQSCKKLIALDLSFNDFDLESGASLARGLIHCKNLKELTVAVSFNDDSAAEFFGGMKTVTLLELNLSFNNIGEKGMQALVKNINLSSLNALCLQNNNIGCKGAITLASSLKQCSILRYLDLSNNNISLSGIIALAEGLSTCTSLECLSLSFNAVGPVGAAVFNEILISCNNLVNFI